MNIISDFSARAHHASCHIPLTCSRLDRGQLDAITARCTRPQTFDVLSEGDSAR